MDRVRLIATCKAFLAAVEPLLIHKEMNPEDLPVNIAASDAEAQWSDEFLAAIAAAQKGVDLWALEDAIADGDIDAAMAAIPLDKLTVTLRSHWQAGMLKLIEAGATAAMPALHEASHVLLHAPVSVGGGPRGEGPAPEAPSLQMRFDLKNPRAVAWAHAQSSTLVTQVDDETRQAIRGTIGRAFDNGIAPRVSAREIKGLVGLLDSHATAVQSARARDIANGLSEAQADKSAVKYSAKLLRYRAENIARTETIRASAQGQLELWKQAREKGYLPKDVRRVWVAGQTERTCEICAGLDGTTADLDGVFGGDVDTPPAHPSCRCSTSIKMSAGRVSADDEGA